MEEQTSAQSAQATEPLKRETILLAEDDRFVSDIYRRKLDMDGYTVLFAPDGREALKILENNIPDLVLLDIMMPVIDGMEVLQTMKGDERLKNIPVVMLTNLAEKDNIERSVSMGASGYVIKAHFTPSEVVQKIREVLDKQKVQ